MFKNIKLPMHRLSWSKSYQIYPLLHAFLFLILQCFHEVKAASVRQLDECVKMLFCNSSRVPTVHRRAGTVTLVRFSSTKVDSFNKEKLNTHKHKPNTLEITSEKYGMKYLTGGRENEIFQQGKCVYRPAGPWTKQVHALLKHLRNEGFYSAPEPLGFDSQGREIVSFIEGEVSNYPLSANAASIGALTSAAQLLRDYHIATKNFLTTHTTDQKCWQLPSREPQEVICHGDFAPYNVVLDGDKAIGIIDFDTCHPGPRIWDIAYALYRWCPFKNPRNEDGFGDIDSQIDRARIFCDSYGLPKENRVIIPGQITDRLLALVNFMTTEAEAGNDVYRSDIKAGHLSKYLEDIEYVRKNSLRIEEGLI